MDAKIIPVTRYPDGGLQKINVIASYPSPFLHIYSPYNNMLHELRYWHCEKFENAVTTSSNH